MTTTRTTVGLWCLLLLALLLGSLAGCTSQYERDMAVARAETDRARYEAQTATANAEARIALANSNAQIQTVREQEETKRETAWLAVLPWLALILVGGGVLAGAVWLVLWFRGKAHLVRVKAETAAMMLPPPPSSPRAAALPERYLLPGPVAARAQETGTKPVRQGSVWLLVDVDSGDVVEVMERRGA